MKTWHPRLQTLAHIALLLAVLAGELFLFVTHAAREQAAIYPRWNDQIQYLTESYTGYEFARVHGFAAGLWQTVVNPSPRARCTILGRSWRSCSSARHARQRSR